MRTAVTYPLPSGQCSAYPAIWGNVVRGNMRNKMCPAKWWAEAGSMTSSYALYPPMDLPMAIVVSLWR